MKIICNGEERQVAEGSTVLSMIVELGLEPDHVVAECDGDIVLRDAYKTTTLHEDSAVELIRFVGGG